MGSNPPLPLDAQSVHNPYAVNRRMLSEEFSCWGQNASASAVGVKKNIISVLSLELMLPH